MRRRAWHIGMMTVLLYCVCISLGCGSGAGDTEPVNEPEQEQALEPPATPEEDTPATPEEATPTKPDEPVPDEAEPATPGEAEPDEAEPTEASAIEPSEASTVEPTEASVVELVEPPLQRPIITAEGFDPKKIEYPDATFPINYAVVVSRDTRSDPEWSKVLQALCAKYQAEVFVYEGDDPRVALRQLKYFSPRYVCVLAKPDELKSVQRCMQMIEMVRTIDADQYLDAVWAIFTAHNTDDAMRMINAKPLVVANGLSHVGGGWLGWFRNGLSFSEGVAGAYTTKQPGKEPEKHDDGPQDTTERFVQAANSNTYHIVSSSGHATERDWAMGYSYRSGRIVSAPEATLVGIDTKDKRHSIRTDNAKIYYSPGNCLIAHVSHTDCMCLAWMHSGGVNQFFGHITTQTRKCWAWGVAEYFFDLQGRYSFAQAVYLNTQAGLNAVMQDKTLDDESRQSYARCVHVTLLYGDPAWEARLAKEKDPGYDQDLTIEDLPDGKVKLTFSVTANGDIGFFERQGHCRPAMAILPFKIVSAGVHRTLPDGSCVTVLDDLLIYYPSKGPDEKLAKGQSRKVSVVAERASMLDEMPTFPPKKSAADDEEPE